MTEQRKKADEKAERIRMIRGMINAHVSRGEIKRTLSVSWKCSPRSVERYITEAYQQLRAEIGRPRDELVGESYAFWSSQVANQKLSTQLRFRARENLDKLLGTHAPVKAAATQADGSPAVIMSPFQVLAAIREELGEDSELADGTHSAAESSGADLLAELDAEGTMEGTDLDSDKAGS